MGGIGLDLFLNSSKNKTDVCLSVCLYVCLLETDMDDEQTQNRIIRISIPNFTDFTIAVSTVSTKSLQTFIYSLVLLIHIFYFILFILTYICSVSIDVLMHLHIVHINDHLTYYYWDLVLLVFPFLSLRMNHILSYHNNKDVDVYNSYHYYYS